MNGIRRRFDLAAFIVGILVASGVVIGFAVADYLA